MNLVRAHLAYALALAGVMFLLAAAFVAPATTLAAPCPPALKRAAARVAGPR